jgi:hypothetical protein
LQAEHALQLVKLEANNKCKPHIKLLRSSLGCVSSRGNAVGS